MVWSKGERSKRLNVFGAEIVEEGGIISTDTERFERVVEGGSGEREGEEAIEGGVRMTAAEVEGEFESRAAIRVETVCSGFETAEAIFEDTAATVAMCSSCDKSRRCDQE